MNRDFRREVHAADFGIRLRNNAENHLIERAVAPACQMVLEIGTFLADAAVPIGAAVGHHPHHFDLAAARPAEA
jgi:hypothetical protein